MKSPAEPKCFSAIMAFAALTGFSRAATVLIIDVSNPAEVTFTSVNANSQTSSTLDAGSQGFTLQNFFRSNVNYPSTTKFGGDLRASNVQALCSGLGTFNFEANDGLFVAGNDLSIYANSGGGTGTQVFNTTSRAFTGTATVNFSSTPSALPALGTTGTVYSGYLQSGTAGQGLVIGEYVVVPEPAPLMVLGAGLLPLLVRRRR